MKTPKKLKHHFALIALIALTGCQSSSHKKHSSQAAAQQAPLPTADRQALLSPTDIVEELKSGNKRFVSGKTYSRDFKKEIKSTADGQFPKAVILSCIDSRVPAEVIFDKGIGYLFNTRIAGNTVNSDILGSLEFATKAAGAKVILVMGHTECGALKGACSKVKMGKSTGLLNKFEAPIKTASLKHKTRDPKNSAFFADLTEENVDHVIKRITKESKIIKQLVDEGKVAIKGAVYDVSTGKVKFL